MRGETLTRADLAEAVHQEVGLTRQDCAGLVERTLELIAEALQAGEAVKLSGFGVFQVREKRARMGRNPKTGEPAAIEPRRVISFRASQVMKSRIEAAHKASDSSGSNAKHQERASGG
jgi:integration host factor subunit alpha